MDLWQEKEPLVSCGAERRGSPGHPPCGLSGSAGWIDKYIHSHGCESVFKCTNS